MRTTMTVEQLLQNTSDGDLLDIQEELLSGIVPATGYAHLFARKINKMIDKGELCINPSTYRKVYLPTLAKVVQKELARRYTRILQGKDYYTEVPALEKDNNHYNLQSAKF